MASSDNIGMNPETVESQSAVIGGYSGTLESIADDVARTGWASRSPSLFSLIPGVDLVLTAGSVALAESAAADVRAAVASAQELLGRLAAQVEEQRYASSGEDGSYVFGFISHAEAQQMYEDILANPDLLLEFGSMKVYAFFSALTPEQSEALWRSAPEVVGNLSGAPLDVRVNANRLNAIADLESGDYTSAAHREYLVAMRDGNVQLVTYDPENHRLVEALGLTTWDAATETFIARQEPPTEVITYVPGTFTTDESMYRGDARDFPAALARNPDAVVFIYKDGVFPGGINGVDDPIGGLQANDLEFAKETGQQLNLFQQDLRLETSFLNADFTAVGHSWGLANITNSEVYGAQYDNVVSLAGAWVPEDWAPDPATEYSHHSYVDWLSVAQDLVPVGEGRNPDVTPGFDVHRYEGPNDAGVGLNPIELVEVLKENHDLVATSKEENEDVYYAVEREIFG